MTLCNHDSKISGSQQLGALETTTATELTRTAKKAIGLGWQNNNFARASPFLYVSLPSLHDCEMKLPNFTRPFDRVREVFVFYLFLNLGTD